MQPNSAKELANRDFTVHIGKSSPKRPQAVKRGSHKAQSNRTTPFVKPETICAARQNFVRDFPINFPL
jgi:hypothetical protein